MFFKEEERTVKKTYRVPNAFVMEWETKDVIAASGDGNFEFRGDDSDEGGSQWGPIQNGTPIY